MQKRAIFWVSVGVVFATLLLAGLSGRVSAEQPETSVEWSEHAEVIAQKQVYSMLPGAFSCSSSIRKVYVQGVGQVDACVFGKDGSTRLVRYLGERGYLYAVALYDDITYTRVDNLCKGKQWCVYSSESDTLLAQISIGNQASGHTVVDTFSRYLVKYETPDTHYRFEYNGTGRVITTASGLITTGAAGISSNGKWALVELRERGFVRVNMETGQYKRIAALSGNYGHGYNPSYELTMSNDGQYAVAAGANTGVTLFAIDEQCGGIPVDPLQKNQWPPNVTSCDAIAIDWYMLFPGFRAGHIPRFSDDGMKLSLYVDTHSGNGLLRAVVAPAPNNENTLPPLYVALGDSFVSGEGETDDSYYRSGTNIPTNKCHVSLRSYPYLLHQSLSVDSYNSACSGARSNEVLRQSVQLLKDITAHTVDYISVGVGGNDVNIMGKLKTCLGIGTCEWALPENRMQTAHEIEALYPKLVSLFADIQQTHPQATLFTVGYPEVINYDSSAQCSLPLSVLLSSEERRYMHEAVRYLNTVLKAASEQVEVKFVDVSNAYGNERLCDESQDAMNGIRLGDDYAPIAAFETFKVIGAESFHPTPRGHELVARAIHAALADDVNGLGCEGCGVTPIDIVPSEYWNIAASPSNAPRLISDIFLSTNKTESGQSVSFSFPAGSFRPFEDVRIALHSNVQELVVMKADSTGALSGTAEVPDVPTGYHTVHAVGQSFSGKPIDRYEVVHIGLPEDSLQTAQPSQASNIPDTASTSNSLDTFTVPNTTDKLSDVQIAQTISQITNEPLAIKQFGAGSAVQGVATKNNLLKKQSASGNEHRARVLLWGGLGIIALIIGVILYKISRRRV